jgi:ubiquinone/menaquinone biosynthesis C-methylase UbiE
MEAETVRDYFERPDVVADYARAAEEVGLWESEKTVFAKFLDPRKKVLELGCGAGRIALGLSALGYADLTATDFSAAMVEAADALAKKLGRDIRCERADATALRFKDASYDAVVFGFNGLMQIPKQSMRLRAISEISRVLKTGGIFIFTTHDRDVERNREYWEAERKQWLHKSQNPDLDDFGDVFYRGEHGNIFIHSPVRSEIEDALKDAGFGLAFAAARSQIAREPQAVTDFSDDCIFWCAAKQT